MENDQIQNNINLETKYNPLKDGSFWAALIIGLIPIIILPFAGIFFLFLLFVWESWIILNKGKNYSFVVGFLMVLFIFFYYVYHLLPSY